MDESYNYNYVRVIGLLIAPDGTVENAVKSPYLNGDETAALLRDITNRLDRIERRMEAAEQKGGADAEDR